MEGMLKDLICTARQLTTTRVRANGLVCPTPLYLFHISVVPANASQAGEFEIYDGHNTSGNLLLDYVFKFTQPCICFHVPLRFNKGLYVKLKSNAKSVTLQYLSVPE